METKSPMSHSSDSRTVTVAASQMACGPDIQSNLKNAESLVREAHRRGAQIILIQELFGSPYFCKDQDAGFFALAEPVHDSRVIHHMQNLARELEVVLPVSFFERANRACFNSLVVLDADGSMVSHYRKSHIPDGPGYQEKFYFSPGDTGFQVSKTRYATIGAAICWDQWFPETARVLVLKGAEILFYPTAIGSEPVSHHDSREQWQRVMQGHSAANMVPVVASNRIGHEAGESCSLDFYGSSFITDHFGAIVEKAPADRQAVLTATFDLSSIDVQRTEWGLFRDRRPDIYQPITSLDGT
jgi:N-carbamoylputrescine amidase